MRNFLYRCPVTQFTVQGTTDQGDREAGRYVSQSCPACGGAHFVDPVTGQGPKGTGRHAPSVDPSFDLETRR